jgi:hypothetical protein
MLLIVFEHPRDKGAGQDPGTSSKTSLPRVTAYPDRVSMQQQRKAPVLFIEPGTRFI